MTELKLTKTEASILTDAAGEGGRITFPPGMKPTTRERCLGRLLRAGLALATNEAPTLAPAGYRAVGLEPPRTAGSKKAKVIALLRRDDGASLGELIAATGWLPHTTRAVLSRLRTSGQDLTKSTRADGATSYQLALVPREPAVEPKAADRTLDAGDERAAA